jgi:putative transposase
MRKGQQKRIATPGQQQWLHFFGAYNWRTDEVITLYTDKKNSEAFCLFLEHLLASTPADRPVVLVLDNASIHHSQVSEAMLAYLEDRFLVFWLPPYCSDLNPIERFWRHLKESACADYLFASLPQLLASVAQTLKLQNDLSAPDRFLFSKT